MIGVKTKITMERTLYIDLPDDATDEEILKAAKQEIILPTDGMYQAAQALKGLHISIPKLDLKDWNTTDVNYNIIK